MSRTDRDRPWRIRLDDPSDPMGDYYPAWVALSPPPRWFRAATYHRPQRRTARNLLAQARQEYRAVGVTETEPARRNSTGTAASGCGGEPAWASSCHPRLRWHHRR